MTWTSPKPRFAFLLALCILFPVIAPAATIEPIQFEKETLENGMRVIYAPLRNAPAVHVRVLYHVGSRDEKPDRQGFAHMFEHMMFRGSTHVAPEQHMKMIGVAGGNSNAFTSFDQTTYVNTIPSNAVQMALYLEADRMASFKVNDTIFQTERKIVAEEWRMRYANQPTGPMFADFSKLAFQSHSYRWTPIGDMDQLRQASSSELQEFFNTYYVPNNACLIIGGDIDVAKTKQWVRQYFGWIPRGPDVPRNAPKEPVQTEPRRLVVYKPNVPLTNVYLGFKTTDYRSDDHFALSLLGDVLSSGNTGRLSRKFVNGDDPSCLSVEAGDYQLEDQSLFMIEAVIQQGKDPDQVEKDILAMVYDVAEKGVTKEELDKAINQERIALIHRRGGKGSSMARNSPATAIATELGDEEVFGGDAARVNTMLPKLEAVTVADIQNVAKKYLKSQTLTSVHYRPDPTGINARRASTQAAADVAAKANEVRNAAVVPSAQAIVPRVQSFPAGYPTEPPVDPKPIEVTFNKGVESTVNGVKVLTLTDKRVPLVDISLIMPGGSDSEPADKVGLGGMVAEMMDRGAAGIPFLDFSKDLETRGISIGAADASDTTRLIVSCTTDQLDHAVMRANQMLTQPMFPKDEFDKFKSQWIDGLVQSLSDPASVADRELVSHLFPGSTLGRITQRKTLEAVMLDDIKNWYQKFYQIQGAMVIISGDVTVEQSKTIVENLLKGLDRKAAPPPANYTLPAAPGRRIILVDNPEGKQATIRFALRSYDVHNDDKYAGSTAGQILSAGIESRLNRYVRAEKGLTYGCYAYFRPQRHQGTFNASVNTNPDTAAAAIEAMIKVFNDMKAENVTPLELSEAQSRVAGAMAMETQTIAQQASMRFEGILNGYPIDHYDKYPKRIAQVKLEEVRDVMNKYVKDDQILFVVVAPASVVKEQLEKLGTVEVLPMPLRRD